MGDGSSRGFATSFCFSIDFYLVAGGVNIKKMTKSISIKKTDKLGLSLCIKILLISIKKLTVSLND